MAANSLKITAGEHNPLLLRERFAWRWLYRLGGAAAMAAVLLTPLAIAVYFIWPPADSVVGHFEQFQSSALAGWLGMDLLYLLTNVILLPTWLALYVALRRVNESFMAVALTLGLVAVVALIAARPILEMQALSEGYATAQSAGQQAIYVAAGEALLALYRGTAFNAHYLLGTIALLIISVVMLNSEAFGRRMAVVGIAANTITLGYYLPAIGVYISIFSVFFYWLWYLMIGRSLWQLSIGGAR
jgi:hypothetical protein